ncbi:phage tail protein [Candidatus Williamhamiltonella defendens]|nr:putative phage tail protein [Candidatus Hamiltonella defensa]AYB48622.1 phage tail protein [Candidatus Hamiltonella defensa]
MNSLFTTSDYQSALLAHLPRGRVWQTGPDNPLTKLSQALATSFQRVDASAMSLLTGGFPATTLELLPEWEESLGLPDNCTIGETYTIERRRQAVVSRLVGKGSLSKQCYISLAKTRGDDITIDEFRQARAGFSVCGEAINGDDWPFVWRVNAQQTTYVQAKCSVSYCGEPLATWGNKILDCTENQLAPPFTVLLFGYH